MNACKHPGASGPCMPRVRDGRCIWCERDLMPARPDDPSTLQRAFGSALELREERGGPRYYLHGKPVHAGTVLCLRLADRTILRVRFEGSHSVWTSPIWTVNLRSGVGFTTASMVIPEDALFNWPEEISSPTGT
jgi:hypothetical protein